MPGRFRRVRVTQQGFLASVHHLPGRARVRAVEPRPAVEFLRQPLHFRQVGAGFLTDDDVTSREDRSETIEHPVRAADHIVAQGGVSPVEPCRQTDAARNGVQLGDGQPRFRRDDVRADDPGNFIAEDALPAQGHEFGRFARIEVFCDPGRLFALDALLVEKIAGTLEEVEPVAEFFQLIDEAVAQGKRPRGRQPLFFVKQSLVRKRLPDGVDAGEIVAGLVGRGHGRVAEALGGTFLPDRTTQVAQRRIFKACRIKSSDKGG